MTVHAIVTAAGEGLRFGGTKNKIFTIIKGKPLIWWTLTSLTAHSSVKHTVVVVNDVSKEHILKEKLLKGMKTIHGVVLGGVYRYVSVYNGFKALPSPQYEDIVLIHDGVRPCVDRQLISSVIETAVEYGAAIPGVKIKPTVKVVDNHMKVIETLDRDRLYEIQTPQAFKYGILKEAYEMFFAYGDGYIPTDEAALLERFGSPIHVVEGSYTNIKVTTQEDVAMILPYL